MDVSDQAAEVAGFVIEHFPVSDGDIISIRQDDGFDPDKGFEFAKEIKEAVQSRSGKKIVILLLDQDIVIENLSIGGWKLVRDL